MQADELVCGDSLGVLDGLWVMASQQARWARVSRWKPPRSTQRWPCTVDQTLWFSTSYWWPGQPLAQPLFDQSPLPAIDLDSAG